MNATVSLLYNNFLLNYDFPGFLLCTFNEQFHIYFQVYPDHTWPHLSLIQTPSLILYHLTTQTFPVKWRTATIKSNCFRMYTVPDESKISTVHCNTLTHSVDDNINTKTRCKTTAHAYNKQVTFCIFEMVYLNWIRNIMVK